ncbi:MAG: pyridoxamine 5'-phosphate oxidase family protein [Rhodococcus sp. (in: high G+C Gram-positive bacteria)]|uniref:pyridoxamine 5'-phosphate oxidase family protein n=1 Tax=Rhodococcus sp. TaxID=1831 RepID=UPI002ADCB18E|nr:pyridoxamine 5'-phosphate oxidase family protein [Rhodococcus sp. (in: high G+C Gram-positive bacteria)]MDZ7930679.1 pyridoxamine 5'-phosphate oxidase family protein [Rhodococcus sp. (in: high G+C Gram-positive bacteria)]
MTNPDIARLRALLSQLDTVSLTTLDDRYRPVSRPMMLHSNDFKGTLFFLTPAHSRIITHLAGMPTVNVSHVSSTTSLSLTGRADFTTDTASVERHWHDELGPWLPDGPEHQALITVAVDEARFWNVRDAAQGGPAVPQSTHSPVA